MRVHTERVRSAFRGRRVSRAGVWLAAGLGVWLSPWAALAQETGALERARAAIGRPEGLIRAEGRATAYGVEGSYTLAFDGEGRFVARTDSVLPMISGFDGQTAWEVDWNGLPRVLELEDLDSGLLGAWAWSGHWAWADGVVGVTEPADRPGTLELSMSGGKLFATVELDPESGLPARLVTHRSMGDEVIELGGYRVVEGVALAHEVTVTSPSGEKTVVRIESAAAGGDGEFGLPAARAGDTAFDPAVPAALEVKRVPTGHLLVKPLVNGRDVGWFIFDTGAGASVLSTPAAEALGVERVGRVTASGVGGAVQTGFYRVGSLSLGRVTVHDQALVGLDLSFLEPYFGVEVAGLIGYDLLARCVAEVDAHRSEIAVYDPADYQLPGGGAWQELLLAGRQAVVRAGFEGREGLFRLDTGAAQSTITFHAPSVERLGLLEGRDTSVSMSAGVGGAVAARAGVLESFVFAGQTFEELPVRFATERKGAFADAYTDGSIGGQVLGPFRAVFDYPHRRVAFLARE
jgi:hypothetical protein